MNRFPQDPLAARRDTPELPEDPRWEACKDLLRAADRPPKPDPVRMAAIRAVALQRCAWHRRSVWARMGDAVVSLVDALGSHTRIGRMVQLAGAAAAGAILVVSLQKSPAPENIAASRGTSAVSVEASVAGTGPGVSLPATGSAASASADMEIASARLMLTPVASPMSIINKSSTTAVPEGSHVSPGLPSPTGTGSAAAESDTDLQVVPVLMQPSFPDSKMGLTPPASVAAAASASDPAATAFVEAIGRLKLNLYLSGEERFLGDVQKVESAVVEMLERGGRVSAEGDQIKALRLFRQAEAAAQEKRYSNAITAYSQVAKGGSKDLLAFMAHLQIADIEFEHLSDFGSALEEYQVCLSKYPHFISEERRNRILQRVELLTQTSENNWEPLRMYLEAQKSTPQVAALRLLDLLERYPDNQLAGTSAQMLADLAAADVTGQRVDVDRVLKTLQEVLGRARTPNSTSPQAAAIQFAIADIFQRRLFNPRQAVVQLGEALNMNPSPELASVIRNRLQEIYQQRAATPTP